LLHSPGVWHNGRQFFDENFTEIAWSGDSLSVFDDGFIALTKPDRLDILQKGSHGLNSRVLCRDKERLFHRLVRYNERLILVSATDFSKPEFTSSLILIDSTSGRVLASKQFSNQITSLALHSQ
jgi:hypothetical protein